MNKNLFFISLASFALMFSACKEDGINPDPGKGGDYEEPGAELAVTGFNPEAAFPLEEITIYGEGFGTDKNAVEVLFGTVEATVSKVTTSSIVCTVPEIAHGPYTVTVGIGDQEYIYEAAKFDVKNRISITGFSPERGSAGSDITLNGTRIDLADDVKVYFGDDEAVVTAKTETTITATIPDLDEAEYTVKAVMDGEDYVAEGKFMLLNSLSIGAFSPEKGKPGDAVTITGTKLTSADEIKVWFGDTEATVTATTVTALTVTVPSIPEGNTTLKVVADGAEFLFPDKVFTCEFTYTLSLISGDPIGSDAERKTVDGSLQDGRFNLLRAIGVMAGGKLVVIENIAGKPRVIDIPGNSVSTVTLDKLDVTSNDISSSADFSKCWFISDWDMETYEFNSTTPTSYVKLQSHGQDAGLYRRAWGHTMVDDGVTQTLWWVDTQARLCSRDVAGNTINIGPMIEGLGNTGDWWNHMAYSKKEDCFYLSSMITHSIYKITKTGESSVFAGTGSGGYFDGTLATAQFNEPSGMAIDADGNIYVADFNNCAIRKIVLQTGMVMTVAGQPTDAAKEGIVNGDQSVSKLGFPRDISIDENGDFYVAEFWGARVRKLVVSQ